MSLIRLREPLSVSQRAPAVSVGGVQEVGNVTIGAALGAAAGALAGYFIYQQPLYGAIAGSAGGVLLGAYWSGSSI